jgi:hypothetical protein
MTGVTRNVNKLCAHFNILLYVAYPQSIFFDN